MPKTACLSRLTECATLAKAFPLEVILADPSTVPPIVSPVGVVAMQLNTRLLELTTANADGAHFAFGPQDSWSALLRVQPVVSRRAIAIGIDQRRMSA
jgi:hypothetical protein